jgi:hypothetical protein
VTPQEFAEWKRLGEQELGFAHVESGPLVRSSYHAEKQARTAVAGGVGEIQDILEADVPAPAELVGAARLVQIEGVRAVGCARRQKNRKGDAGRGRHRAAAGGPVEKGRRVRCFR